MKFAYKLTRSGIYAHLMYRVHQEEAKLLDAANVLEITKKAVKRCNW